MMLTRYCPRSTPVFFALRGRIGMGFIAKPANAEMV